MRRVVAVMVVGVVLIGSGPAWAQHKRKDRDVLIENKKKILTIYANPATTAGGPPPGVAAPDREIAILRSAQTIVIQPNEVVQVGIDRHNPLIFVYAWKGVVLTPTADYAAAVTFAASLKELLGVAPFAAMQKATEGRMERATDDERRALASRLSKVREIAKAVGFTDDTVRDIAKLRNDLAGYVGDIPRLRKQTLDDASVATAQTHVVEWKVPEKTKSTNSWFAALTNARNELLQALVDDPDLFASDPGFVSTINMLSNEEANVRRLLAVATQFAEGMALVGTRLPLGEPVAFDAANNATATVEITYAAGAQDLVNEHFPAPATRPSVGSFTITFEPFSNWAFGGGPSVFYVFGNSPEEKDIGWRPAGMLTITKRSWLESLAAVQIEMGVTPETDRVGLYLGLGIRVKGVFHLSAGVTAQQFKNSDDSDWPASGYLGVTVDLVPKK